MIAPGPMPAPLRDPARWVPRTLAFVAVALLAAAVAPMVLGDGRSAAALQAAHQGHGEGAAQPLPRSPMRRAGPS